MKSIQSASLLCTFLLTTSAGVSQTARPNSQVPPVGNAAVSTDSQARNQTNEQASADVLSDKQIHSIVTVANKGEIDHAAAALKTLRNKELKDFAQMMVRDHNNTVKELKTVKLDTKDNEKGSDLQKNFEISAKSKIDRLKSLKGGDFDKAFAEDQVALHMELLTALESQLIPHAKNDKLNEILQKMRPNVASHLDKIKKIHSSLDSQM